MFSNDQSAMQRLAFILLFLSSLAYSQEPAKRDTTQHQIPINPNMVDEQGRKTGKWTILFDANWEEIDNVDSATFYRLITYKEGKPQGKTFDYYRNGQVQWEAVIISENPDTHDGWVKVYNEEGILTIMDFYNKGEYDQLESLTMLQGYVDSLGNKDLPKLEYAHTLKILGSQYSIRGKTEKAEKYLLIAKEIIVKKLGKSSTHYVEILTRQADNFLKDGRSLEAKQLLLEAKEIIEKHFNTISNQYVGIISSLSWQAYINRRYDEAESLILKVIDFKKELLGDKFIDSRDEIEHLNQLGVIYISNKNYDEAKSFFLKALGIAAKINSDQWLLHRNLGSTYLHSGNYPEAEKYFLKALEGFKGSNVFRRWRYSDLASLYQAIGRFQEAENFHIKALDETEDIVGKDHTDYHWIRWDLASLYFSMNKKDDAKNLFIETIKFFESYLLNMFNNLGERERENFYSFLTGFFSQFYYYSIIESPSYPELSSLLFNLRISSKSILLNTSNKIKRQILLSNDRVLIDLYDEVQSMKQMISQYQNSQSVSRSERSKHDSLNKVLSEKDNQLSKHASFYAAEKKQYSWQDVKSTLGKGEAAIEIIRVKKWDFQKMKSTNTVLYAALIITSKTKKYPELILFNNGNQLEEKYIQYYKNTVRFQKEDTLSYDKFWSPLKKHLKGIKTVYFSPDGVFNSINLQTLYNVEKKKYLMEEVDVRIVTSTKDLLTVESSTMINNYVVMVGNPDFGEESVTIDNRSINTALTLDSLERSGISSLPGTKKEIDIISELFRQKGWREDIWTQQDATEEKLKNMFKPKVLHIATHGFFEPDSDDHSYRNNPLHRSGLLLSGAEKVFQKDGTYIQSGEEDGILTAFEAMNLNIENTELVVLSACETGLGEIRNGEGVYGLQRALKVAGARSILISLWKVNDQVTQELMVDFYTNWLGGMSKREALKKTQLKLKEKYKSPFYWGAFVLIGE